MSKNWTVSDSVAMSCLEARVPVVLVGDPGTSKTVKSKAYADQLGKELITVIASRMDPQDLSGFPTKGEYKIKDEHGERIIPVTEYAPQRWQVEIMEKKKVILLLDEFSNAHPSVRASMLSFIQDRQFPNGDYLPEETAIIVAMNPTDSAADGYELDPATTNRMVFLSWNPSRDEWLEGMLDNWGKGLRTEHEAKWRSLIVRFITEEPGALHMMKDDDLNDGAAYGLNTNDSSDLAVLQYAWASRRSWDNLSKILGVHQPGVNTEIEDKISIGTVGAKAASRFRDWIRKNGVLDVKSIVAEPRKFNGWNGLSIDDLNLVIRTAVDGVNSESTKDQIMNVAEIFTIIHEIDKDSIVAPYLQDLVRIGAKSTKATESEKKEIRDKLLSLARTFKEISSRRN